MHDQWDPYLQKLRYYKELYLIDEESYGDWPPKKMEEMRATLDDFVKYVELTSNVTKPIQSEENKDINLKNFKRFGFEL
tara:strand:- start:2465 stop:2701 length:237 start_codon:yes stop_codon:yes gene_type:complete